MQKRDRLDRQLERRQHAARMRAVPTASERLLWEQLRGCRLGAAFRRQVPVANRFVVDFLAPREKVVVEVDGGYHAKRAAADERRDAALRRAGRRVVHVTAAEVTAELPAVLDRIRAALVERLA